MSEDKTLKDKDLELVSGGEDNPINPDDPKPVNPFPNEIVCPNCQSKKIDYLFTDGNYKKVYKCIDCFLIFRIGRDGKVEWN